MLPPHPPVVAASAGRPDHATLPPARTGRSPPVHLTWPHRKSTLVHSTETPSPTAASRSSLHRGECARVVRRGGHTKGDMFASSPQRLVRHVVVALAGDEEKHGSAAQRADRPAGAASRARRLDLDRGGLPRAARGHGFACWRASVIGQGGARAADELVGRIRGADTVGVADEPSQGAEQVRAAEVIGALCLATDLGMGFPFEMGYGPRWSRRGSLTGSGSTRRRRRRPTTPACFPMRAAPPTRTSPRRSSEVRSPPISTPSRTGRSERS